MYDKKVHASNNLFFETSSPANQWSAESIFIDFPIFLHITFDFWFWFYNKIDSNQWFSKLESNFWICYNADFKNVTTLFFGLCSPDTSFRSKKSKWKSLRLLSCVYPYPSWSLLFSHHITLDHFCYQSKKKCILRIWV